MKQVLSILIWLHQKVHITGKGMIQQLEKHTWVRHGGDFREAHGNQGNSFLLREATNNR